MTEETKVDASEESPFDKETPVVEAGTEVVAEQPVATIAKGTDKEEDVAEVPATKATPASTDYSQYASMTETPTPNEHRVFNYVAMSGGVETEVITTEAGEVEKRKPATAFKLLFTEERDENDRAKSEELALPLKVVPIKYRMVMEHKTGDKGEIKVLGTSEFNGNNSDLVVVYKYGPNSKGGREVIETFGPMTVIEARKKFVDAEGKQQLKDRARVYGLVGGELVQFIVKGTGLWEMESELHNGKTEASRTKHPFLGRYLSEFAMTDPYFLYEMEVNAVYRDHGSIKYYRPTFTKGARISAEVEEVVIPHLKDLHKYFAEMDEATKAFVATEVEAPVVADAVPATNSDLPFEDDAVVATPVADDDEY
jgi:hypothetical protein